jgi:hypothetical protein
LTYDQKAHGSIPSGDIVKTHALSDFIEELKSLVLFENAVIIIIISLLMSPLLRHKPS